MIQTYSQQSLKGLVDFREVFNAFVTTQEIEGMRGSRKITGGVFNIDLFLNICLFFKRLKE